MKLCLDKTKTLTCTDIFSKSCDHFSMILMVSEIFDRGKLVIISTFAYENNNKISTFSIAQKIDKNKKSIMEKGL